MEYVVKGLVEHPEAVTITPVMRSGTTVYQLRVHPNDMGRIIGKDGQTINAIRSLVTASSAKRGLRCVVEVVGEKTSK